MATYRVFLIGSENRIVSFKPIEAETGAWPAARQFTNGCELEVWRSRSQGRAD
jgi:hypothetical protein